MSIPENAPKPRLCHLRKRPDFAGYGFNLHAEKGRAGQFIGKVDEGSPAALAGLKEGDRIVEVNGTNIANENHQQVVQRIKAVEDETKFLVVDSETDDYYRDRNIVIQGGMDNIAVLVTPKLGDDETDVKVNGDSKSRKSSSSSDDDDDAEAKKHRPRLSIMRIWDDFPGYGFNLHAEKGKSAQFIGKVDEKSPAEAAGLREGDRIVEVNGECVLAQTHQDVVKKIKSNPKEVTMLLLDTEAEKYFNKKGITVSNTFENIERIECPEKNPHTGKDGVDTGAVVAAVAVAAVAADDFGDHKIRLCHIKAGEKGFGFNMQTEKGLPGQYIGSVDDDSPAERAGLKKGDRIIEVNGESVEGNTHKQVVEKIRAKPGETTLLVVDKDADKFFTEKNIKIGATLACVVKSDSATENGVGGHKKISVSDDYESVADEIAAVAKKAEKEDEKKAEAKKAEEKKTEETKLALKIESSNNNNNSPSSPTKSVESPSSPKSPVVINGIEFAASAEEARRKMSKKKTARDSNMSMKDKYALFQKL